MAAFCVVEKCSLVEVYRYFRVFLSCIITAVSHRFDEGDRK
jgi:hypothetical protein